MNDSQDRLREMLHRRGDRVHSSLTISDIRDAGLRSHRHPMRLLGPVLVATSVVILVAVVAIAGRGRPSTPPAGPVPGVSRTVTPTTTAVHSSRFTSPSLTGTTTTSPPVAMSTAAATTTVQASP